MPWDIRTESQSAKMRRLEREAQREKEAMRRLEREKYNCIEQYLLSGDEQVHSNRTMHRGQDNSSKLISAENIK